MDITPAIAQLISDLEYEVGRSCYNESSLCYASSCVGRNIRYPVHVYKDGYSIRCSHFDRIGGIYGFSPEDIYKTYYQFGVNALYIGKALINVLNLLETRYNLNFNNLESQQNSSR